MRLTFRKSSVNRLFRERCAVVAVECGLKPPRKVRSLKLDCLAAGSAAMLSWNRGSARPNQKRQTTTREISIMHITYLEDTRYNYVSGRAVTSDAALDRRLPLARTLRPHDTLGGHRSAALLRVEPCRIDRVPSARWGRQLKTRMRGAPTSGSEQGADGGRSFP